MWDHEIKAMASTHAIIASSVFMATVLPAVLVPGFSVYGAHLLWLYSTSAAVTVVSVAVFWLLGITPPTKKHTLGYKLSRLFRSCLYFFLSCLFFHTVVVLYGAPLIDLRRWSRFTVFQVGLGDVLPRRAAHLTDHTEVSLRPGTQRAGLDTSLQSTRSDVCVGHLSADHCGLHCSGSLGGSFPHTSGLGQAVAGLACFL